LTPQSVWHLTRGEGVVVAVIDSGVSETHPVLAGKVLDGRDFGLPDNAGRCDQDGHGTLIAGIIAGDNAARPPFTGVAPDARILPGRAFEDSTQRIRGEDFTVRVPEAIRWAVDNGAKVINLSLDGPRSDALRQAVEYARDHDVVMVASAGNVRDDQFQAGYPALYDEVIAVAAIGPDGRPLGSSGGGSFVDLAAPGADAVGPAPRGDGFLASTGTSFAAAYVSGVAALVRARYPRMRAPEVVHRLLATADRPPEGHTEQVGYGVVNPYRAVTTVLGSRENPTPAPVAAAPVPADPLASQRTAAVWLALGGALLTGLLLIVPAAVRRGRRRGWRPTRPTA
jgi:type VII secretion-associated serine protease mycosin